MFTLNYFRVIDWNTDAAKQNEQLQDMRPKQQKEAYVGLPIYLPISNIFLKITNSTSADVNFTGTWYNKIVENH